MAIVVILVVIGILCQQVAVQMLIAEVKRLKMANAAAQATLDQTLNQLDHVNNKLHFNEQAYQKQNKQLADLILDLAAAEQNIDLLANQNKELTNQLYEIQSP